jgi:chromosome segregation ATPase
MNIEEFRKRQRTLSTETAFSNDGDDENDISNNSNEINSLINYIKNLNMDISLTNKKEYLKIEGILKLIDYKLNKLDNIEKLEFKIKKLENKFDNIIREKDYEISNLKEEMDNLKFQLNDNTNEIKNMNNYYV